jgi:BlaI family penicillinase repressor
MATKRFSKLELRFLEVVWAKGEASIREMQQSFPELERPAYSTVQTMVYRLEAKKVLRRTRKVGNFHMFAALIARDVAQRTLVDDLLAAFGGESRPLVAHLIVAGKLTMADVEFAEATLRDLKGGEKR